MAPAIVHDYLYWYQPCSKAEADAVMFVAMNGTDTGKLKAPAIYQGVRDFGQSAFKKNGGLRAKGQSRTFSSDYLVKLLSSPVDSKETLSTALKKAKANKDALVKERAEDGVKTACKAAIKMCGQDCAAPSR